MRIGFEFGNKQLAKDIRELTQATAAHNLGVSFEKMLSEFRREFLQTTRVDVKGPKGGRSPSGSGRGIGYRFKWRVRKGRRPEQVQGEFFTDSKVALGLEHGPRIKAKRGGLLYLPMGGARGGFGGEGRVRRNFASLAAAIKRYGIDRFVFQRRRGGTQIVYFKSGAKVRSVGEFTPVKRQKRGRFRRQRRLIPVFRGVPEVKLPRILGLFDRWERFERSRGRQRLVEALAATVKGRLLR